jgi:glycosyltransferase involved in cell wall biosynthesis
MARNEKRTTKSPLLSVVMANFNGERYIGDAIRSVLRQTFHEFELIIIDDGSIDESREIIRAMAEMDPRITILFQEHLGLVKALNRGCNASRGVYVARLDADDIAMPQRFEQQMAFLRRGSAVLVGGSIECIDSDGKERFVVTFPKWLEGLKELLMVNCYLAHTTVMFRREVFAAAGGYRPRFECAEDYDLFLRISEEYVIENLSEVLCQYRLHDAQASLQKVSQQVISSIGARLAAWARRSHLEEPKWKGDVIAREDLASLGLRSERIDELITKHRRAGIKELLDWKKFLET